MNIIKGKGSKEGQVIIEFALMLPILILILGGIIEFGILFYNRQVIVNASREGARVGIVYEPTKSIETTVKQYCTDRLITFGAAKDPTVASVKTPVSGSDPDNLTVTVTYPYEMILPGLLNLGPTINLQAKTVMRME